MTACELTTAAQEGVNQHRDHQQRLPGHGPPVAGVLLRRPLRRDPDALARLRGAGRGPRPSRAARDRARRRRGRGARGPGDDRGPVVIDFRVEQEDSVYPMVPAGADLARDDPAAERRRSSRPRRIRDAARAPTRSRPARSSPTSRTSRACSTGSRRCSGGAATTSISLTVGRTDKAGHVAPDPRARRRRRHRPPDRGQPVQAGQRPAGRGGHRGARRCAASWP